MKHYDQYCPIACSLGLVGERWTLLVVRELMHGPKRYTDLVDGLNGIGTNILAARLEGARGCGVVAAQAAAARGFDRLRADTDTAWLRPVLHELARFGARLMGPPPPMRSIQAGCWTHSISALSPISPAGRLAFRIGDEEASLVDGVARPGLVDDPDVFVESDAIGFYHLVVNRQTEGVRIEGDFGVLERLIDAFGPKPAMPEPLLA